MERQAGQRRLLTQHFFRHLLDNDLLSPGEDLHAPLAAVLAATVTLFGGVAAILLGKYNPPRPLPLAERLAMAVDDKVLFLGGAMSVMALVTVLVWDSLSLDPRDAAFIGPLPVRARTLLLSKTAAVAGSAVAFAVAVSVPPAVLFPVVMLANAPVGLPYGLRSMGAQAAAGLLACALVFLALVSLRNLVSLILPAKPARRALLVAQGLLIPALLTTLLLMPLLAVLTRPAVEAGSPAALMWPPLWFLGVNDIWVGRDAPILRQLARTGMMALAGVGLLACATYLLAFRRDLSRFRIGPPEARRGGGRRAPGQLAMRLVVADPLARASFAFTVATLLRSARHRLCLVGYLGAGLALACVSVAAARGRVDRAMFDLAPVTLAVQLNLLFFLLVGVRVAAALPADIRAVWLFRFDAGAALSRYLAGHRAAVFCFGVLPLVLLMVPAHALLWGWYAATVHFAWGLAFALALWTVLFWRFDRLPFACAATPGRARLTNRLWLYVVGYLAAVYASAAIEQQMIGRRALGLAWAGLVAACAARVVVREPSRPPADRLPSFDEPAGEIQRLGL